MLRVQIKKELLKILNSMVKLHHKGLVGRQPDDAFVVLKDCQTAAIALGESIEANNVEGGDAIVSILEDYCENVYLLTEQLTISEKDIEKLDEALNEVIKKIKHASAKLQIVYLPYKASMWDSMESVWRASCADERCECFVIPIPYYKFDSRSRSAHLCYEGADFPDYVPIINFNNFSVEQERPDIVYVHNPYDECNYVTSIHPNYYSRNLQPYVGKLVYIPYYVSCGVVSERQKDLPVYHYMDYMIVQSKMFKDGFSGLPYQNKLLPFGSPKFDRVIRLCKELNQMKVQNDKKVIMLNTSINCFLHDGETLLNKLRIVFEFFSKRKDVVLIWRPHPLIEATIEAMRPHLMGKYFELMQFFINNQIGMLDDNPDITHTIAEADAYIGESASSVVHLFGAAGKPIFVLNNYILEDFGSEQKRRIAISDIVEEDGITWLVPLNYNGLFVLRNKEWNNIEFCGRYEMQAKWTCAFTSLIKKDNRIYLSPYDIDAPCVYDIEQKEFVRIGKRQNCNIGAIRMTKYKNKIFYILQYQDAILSYDMVRNSWETYSDIFSEVKKDAGEDYIANIWEYDVWDNFLWLTTAYSNKVLRFDMEDGQINAIEVGDKENAYSAVACEANKIYLAETQTGKVICVDMVNKEQTYYEMPEEFCICSETGFMNVAHSKLLCIKNWIITLPHNGNCMVKIDKNTGKSYLLIPDFWKDAVYEVNGYNPKRKGTAHLLKQIGDTQIIVQRMSDNAIAKVDIESDQYEIMYPQMSEATFAEFMQGQDGFEKIDINSGFVCRESALFSLEKFVDDLVNDKLENVKKRQMEELACMAENLDGSCGEKVHKYMMEMLEKEE